VSAAGAPYTHVRRWMSGTKGAVTRCVRILCARFICLQDVEVHLMLDWLLQLQWMK